MNSHQRRVLKRRMIRHVTSYDPLRNFSTAAGLFMAWERHRERTRAAILESGQRPPDVTRRCERCGENIYYYHSGFCSLCDLQPCLKPCRASGCEMLESHLGEHTPKLPDVTTIDVSVRPADVTSLCERCGQDTLYAAWGFCSSCDMKPCPEPGCGMLENHLGDHKPKEKR